MFVYVSVYCHTQTQLVISALLEILQVTNWVLERHDADNGVYPLPTHGWLVVYSHFHILAN